MIDVGFHEAGEVEDEVLKFAVIAAEYDNEWIYVRHRERDTWEIPGGHREENEDITDTAKRELFEETGAKKFSIRPVCDYSVTRNEKTTYGRLFYSVINELGKLPNLEIEEIKLFENMPRNLTYDEIQPHLFKKVLDWKDNL
ncbi:NUDIX domain-containing protein [Wukongibacter baidiensis]|uniref:NUDIX hydrolase n=1 Tax=Wukongibacter baidiensis TaxID=1723361 RepID=UPI003D7F4C9D